MRNTMSFMRGSSELALAAASANTKDTRVELRTSVDIKEKLRAAASLAGVDMSAFILIAATQAAQRMLDDQRVRVLAAQEWDTVNAILKSDRRPGNQLREFMESEPDYERDF